MKRSFGALSIAYPLPVFLVGTYDAAGKPDVMVAAWGGICCSDPPSIAVSIRPVRQTHKNLRLKKAFTVSIPTADIVSETDYCGIVSGTIVDKFARTGMTPVPAGTVDAPYVDECPVVLECRLKHGSRLGSHTLFIGEILDVKIDEAVLDAGGRPDITLMNPLIFDVLRAGYYTPGPFVGEAFVSGKKFLKE